MSLDVSSSTVVSDGQTASELPDRLHLGCGEDQRGAGWLDTDVNPAVDPDEVLDITETPWPYPDNAFWQVRAEHVLEHVRDPVPVMREATRVTRVGGRVVVTVPLGANARTDPTHADQWTWETPRYFTADGPYAWEAGCDLTLVERHIELCPHKPLYHITRLLERYAERWPLFVPELPGVSGELTAVWEVVNG